MGSAVAGYGGSVKIGANTVANVKQWELPLGADLYDTSSLGSQWKTYVAGLLGSDAKVDVFTDLTDTNGQIAMQSALLGGTTVTLNLLTSTANGATQHTYSGTAFVKSLDSKVVVNGVEEMSLTLTFSGTITYS